MEQLHTRCPGASRRQSIQWGMGRGDSSDGLARTGRCEIPNRTNQHPLPSASPSSSPLLMTEKAKQATSQHARRVTICRTRPSLPSHSLPDTYTYPPFPETMGTAMERKPRNDDGQRHELAKECSKTTNKTAPSRKEGHRLATPPIPIPVRSPKRGAHAATAAAAAADAALALVGQPAHRSCGKRRSSFACMRLP